MGEDVGPKRGKGRRGKERKGSMSLFLRDGDGKWRKGKERGGEGEGRERKSLPYQ